jgi:hypothetical protein
MGSRVAAATSRWRARLLVTSLLGASLGACADAESAAPEPDAGSPGGAAGAGGGSGGGPVAYGDFSRFGDLGWIDTHVHLWSHHQIDAYVAYQDRFGMQRMVLQSPAMAASLSAGERPNRNAEGLLAKLRYPDRFYLFAGIDLTPLLSGGETALTDDLGPQVDEAADAGADGIKIYMRHSVVDPLQQTLGFDFLPDNPSLAGLFQAAAARGLPVLIHIDEQYISHGQAAFGLYPGVTWVVTHMLWART